MNFKTFPFLLLFSFVLKVSAQSPEAVQPAFEELFSEFQNIRDFTMSEDGDEIYFTAQSPLEEVSILIQAKMGDLEWEKQLFLPQSGKYKDLEPFLSPDGLKLYFASNRPLENSSEIKNDFDIWVLDRKNSKDKWSEPINLGSPINSEFNEFYPSVSKNGNIYFTSDRPNGKGKDDIYISEKLSNNYSSPISLSASINSDGYEFNSFISPDEKFMIYSGYNREDGLGSGDLYITFKKQDGSWEKSKNLGAILNSDKMDYCPFIDFHSQTLYFTSKRSKIKAEEMHSLDDFKTALKIPENGISKIYKVSLGQIPELGLKN